MSIKVFKLLRIKIGVVERKRLKQVSKSLMNEVMSLEDTRRLKKMGLGQ